MTKYLLIIFILLSSYSFAFDSFEFDLDQMQDGEKNLKVIENKLAKIVYPKGFKSEASKIIDVINSIHQAYDNDLKYSGEKIIIVLRPYTAISNAYVSLAPQMSEFVTTPYVHNEMGHSDWLKLLAVHEYRHVIQQQKELHQGNSILYTLLGEQGTALGSIIKFPRWYYEGDAVYAESKYSDYARGDASQFLNSFMALIYNKNIDYDKSYLGSLSQYYPDYYKMGFVIMTYLWFQYGEESVEAIISHANDTFLSFYAFENAIENYTGKGIQTIFNEAQSYFRNRWKRIETKYKPTYVEDINKKSKYFSNYSVIEKHKDSVIAYKTSLDEVPQFVHVSSDGTEKHLFYPTYFSDDSFDVFYNSVIYSDIIPAKRYGLQSTSVVKKYNLKTGNTTTLLGSGFNYLPRLKGKNLLYINFDGHNYRVMIKDTQTQIKSLVYKTPHRITSVAFHQKGVSFVESKKNVSYLKHWNRKTIDVLKAYSNATIWNLRSRGARLYYLSNQEGMAHLYSLKGDIEIRHLNSKFGFLSFALDKNKDVYVSNYTARGAKISKAKLLKLSTKSKKVKLNPIPKQVPKLVKSTYSERDLGATENLLNFHSWNLFPDVVGNNYYFSVTSRNVLNTLSLKAGYTYNFLEQGGGVFGTLSFSTPFAIWDLGFQTIGRGSYNDTTNEIDDRWEERQVSFGPRINLDFSRHGHNHLLSFSYKTAILEATKRDLISVGELNDTRLFSHNFSFQYLYTKQMSSLDLQPDYGLEFVFDSKTGFEVDDSSNESSKQSIFANLYLPSFYQTGLKLTGMYEDRDLSSYEYASAIPFVRGYGSVLSETWTGGSAEFVFPISYNEIDLTNWLYFKRFKGALFYDRVTSANDLLLSSYGAELTAMTHLFRNYDLLIDIGLRTTRLVELESNETEVFLDTVFSY